MDISQWAHMLSEWLGVFAAVWIASISPRFKHRPIGFVHAKRDGIIALSVFIPALALSFLYYQGRIGQQIENFFPREGMAAHALLALACVLAVIVALFLRTQPPKSAGWNRLTLNPALLMGVALGLLTLFLRNRLFVVLGGITSDDITALGLALVAALAEETLFRGYIQLRLNWWLGERYGIVLTAILYALWAAPQFIGMSLIPFVLGVGFYLIRGLLLGWVMKQAGHVTAPAIFSAISTWLTYLG